MRLVFEIFCVNESGGSSGSLGVILLDGLIGSSFWCGLVFFDRLGG